MENQHRKIAGYRELSQEEIDLMNEIKTKGAELGSIVDKLERMQHKECSTIGNILEDNDFETFDQQVAALSQARRWTEIGKTDIQKGLMALTRAVARPSFF